MFSEDSIQYLCSDWWIEQADQVVKRGFLIWAFVPHVNQSPFTILPVGRKDPLAHGGAEVKIEQLQIGARRNVQDLPVAAMSLYDNEVWTAHKSKVRPCLVLAVQSTPVDFPKSIISRMARQQIAPTLVVAPYYGADKDGARAGFPEIFVERIKHAEYTQYFYDQLPLNNKTNESILRLDHLQPIGLHHNSYQLTGYQLSDEALDIIDEWLYWHLWGGVPKGSVLSDFWELIGSHKR